MSVRELDEDEKLIQGLFVSGQKRDVMTINKPGMYKLIFKSRKAEAKDFTRWVTHEVLPQIRKMGEYRTKAISQSERAERTREYERIMKDLNLRGVQILLLMIDNKLFPVTPETRTVFAH